MCKFKVGQRIRCIHPGNYDYLRDNSPFIFNSYSFHYDGDVFVNIIDKEGREEGGYFAHRFVLSCELSNNIKVL